MKETEPVIRVMTMDDFEAVHALWMEIHGFGIRSIDDSREGVERFIRRNPTTSMVAEADGKIVGALGVSGGTAEQDTALAAYGKSVFKEVIECL